MKEPGLIENDVLFGENDYLFLAHGGHYVLEIARGERHIPEESFVNFETNINSRIAYSQERGIKYLHVITPDKQSVMTQYYPFKNPISLGQLYLDRCSSISGSAYYPRDFLQRCYTKGAQVFLKTDTHLTDAGSIAVSRSILEKLDRCSHEEFGDELLKSVSGIEEYVGDLGSKLTPRLVERKVTFKGNPEQFWIQNGIVGGNNGIVDIRFTKHPKSRERLVFFGDSFGRELCRFLSLYFSQSIFLRTPYFHTDIIDAIRPTIIISQNVERYLDYCNSDENRPLFYMYPYMSNIEYAPSQLFAEALSAVCSYGREPYETFSAKIGYVVD